MGTRPTREILHALGNALQPLCDLPGEMGDAVAALIRESSDNICEQTAALADATAAVPRVHALMGELRGAVLCGEYAAEVSAKGLSSLVAYLDEMHALLGNMPADARTGTSGDLAVLVMNALATAEALAQRAVVDAEDGEENE